MNNTAIQTFVKKTRSVCFRIPYPIYETCCESAEKLDLTLTDYFILKIKNDSNTAYNIDNANVKQPTTNQIITKQKNQMELNDSPSRAELKIDKLEMEIEKLSSKNTELIKNFEAEKKRADTTELKCKAEEEAHLTTKKQIPSREDLLLLHGSKFDTLLWQELEKNDMRPIFADAKDLDELGIHPMLHTDLKDSGRTETSNILLEKKPKGVKLPEDKIFKISSKHETK